jgi:hypothetical protein
MLWLTSFALVAALLAYSYLLALRWVARPTRRAPDRLPDHPPDRPPPGE